MILCMTTDDIGIVNDAYKKYDQNIFGIPFCYLEDHSYTGMMNAGEDLFISAHGNDTEIGNREGAPAYTAAQLRRVLLDYILPARHTGRIYVSACESAPVYVNTLRAAFGPSYARRIFGMYGEVDYAIDPPASNNWIMAT